MILVSFSAFTLALVRAIFPVEERFFSSDGSVRNINTGLNYSTIQAAINANETLNGHTILVKQGTYYEHVVVNKSISLIGENRTTTIIDGNGTGTDILVTADIVVIEKFTIRNGPTGIYLYQTNGSSAVENDVIFNGDAILAYYCRDFLVHNNVAGNNSGRGILVSNSRNFTVSNNLVYGNGMYGLNTNSSENGLIRQNAAYENSYDGIGLFGSNNCTIAENDVGNNPLFGIMIDSSNYSLIYHNNVFNNTFQASDVNVSNWWDDGIEGNYWSDYAGVDSNYDGIGDTARPIYGSIQDSHPLMGMFSDFNVVPEHPIQTICNSSISDFQFTDASIYFNATGENGTSGFCRIRIPLALMNGSYRVFVGGTEVPYNLLSCSNETHTCLYFNYTHSTQEVTITPEFPALLVLPLFITATLLATTISRTRRKWQPTRQPIARFNGFPR
jgi:parallel beta-helix repeat protein